MEFEQAVKQYEPMIYAVMRKLNIFKEREDYYQIGLIALWEAFKSYEKVKGTLSAYLYRAIYYAIIDEIRRQTRKENYEQIQDEIPEKMMIDNSCEKLMMSYYMQFLTNEEQYIIHHYYIQQLKDEEIAKKIGRSTDSVKKKRQRSLLKLKRELLKTKKFGIFF